MTPSAEQFSPQSAGSAGEPALPPAGLPVPPPEPPAGPRPLVSAAAEPSEPSPPPEIQMAQRPDYYLKRLQQVEHTGDTERDPQLLSTIETKRHQLEAWAEKQRHRERLIANCVATGVDRLHEVELFRAGAELFSYSKKLSNPDLFGGAEAKQAMDQILAMAEPLKEVDFDIIGRESKTNPGTEELVQRTIYEASSGVKLVETLVKADSTELVASALVASRPQTAGQPANSPASAAQG